MARQVIGRLRSEAEYDQALDEIERYFENEPKSGTPEAARFDDLSRAIETYEAEHWPIEAAAQTAVKAHRVRNVRMAGGHEMAKSTKNTGNPWTLTEIKSLKQLARENTPTRVIGLKLGRTETAIRGKAGREGVSLKPTNQPPYNRRGK